jgi:hypothetical protein
LKFQGIICDDPICAEAPENKRNRTQFSFGSIPRVKDNGESGKMYGLRKEVALLAYRHSCEGFLIDRAQEVRRGLARIVRLSMPIMTFKRIFSLRQEDRNNFQVQAIW